MMRQFGRAVVLCAVSMVLFLAASPALAGEPRTHDGFLLRLSVGGGYGETENTILGENWKLSGGAADLNFAIGGAVKPNFIVHGTLWGWAVSSPDVKIGSATGTADNSTLNMSAFGVGFTYYVMPANFYFSPSIGVAQLSIEQGGATFSTDSGFGLDATIGKEWWVSDGWGLGVAGAFNWHSVGDGDPDISEKWSGPGFGIRFSATLN